ncbi:nucleoside deaminase [Aquimarina brevivitae]|uniref:tRNA(Arg) A34 adenosine deaminase TadA n=1 Tax=Aquimarina brevivitae TaxID=323412 RepID=A0A4Q7PII0_9FLAO|nr:nucleoside deaminase [Aquimarina brevivitae]RZT00058.1 tRNA(Arg) A34 adenosine deaminase TadA [Aquimarina brevivitae]
MEETHFKFMRQAIALARQGKEVTSGGPFGAVITKNNKVLVAVHNIVSQYNDLTKHAELYAIQEACRLLNSKKLTGCVLYTSCEPCMMCLGACHWAQFDNIYYGASAEDALQYGFTYSDMFYASNANSRYQEYNMTQLLRDEAVAVWQDE